MKQTQHISGLENEKKIWIEKYKFNCSFEQLNLYIIVKRLVEKWIQNIISGQKNIFFSKDSWVNEL